MFSFFIFPTARGSTRLSTTPPPSAAALAGPQYMFMLYHHHQHQYTDQATDPTILLLPAWWWVMLNFFPIYWLVFAPIPTNTNAITCTCSTQRDTRRIILQATSLLSDSPPPPAVFEGGGVVGALAKEVPYPQSNKFDDLNAFCFIHMDYLVVYTWRLKRTPQTVLGRKRERPKKGIQPTMLLMVEKIGIRECDSTCKSRCVCLDGGE